MNEESGHGRNGKLRIAFIGGRGVVSKYSGIEAYYEEVGKRLAERGHEVSVYCRSYFTPPVRYHHGMRVVRLPTLRRKHFETFVHSLLSTLHTLASRYDIVHFHSLGSSIFSFIPRVFGMKTVVTVHSLDWQSSKWGGFSRWFLRLCEGTSFRFPNATMVVSRTLRARYLSEHGAETTVVPNGVNPPARRRAARTLGWGLEPKKYILFLGRLSPEKNVHLLIQAFEMIGTDVKLAIAGGTSYTGSYIAELKRHESDRIRFLGWVCGEPLEELLSNALLFVLPSDFEGLSVSLLEAMAYGLCVLTSDIPQNVELVQGAGYTFARGDVEDLQHMLELLLSREDLRAEASRNARARVERDYLWTNVAERVEQVYYSVTDMERTPSRSPVAPGDATY
jgi:glycosyltransferase involved in cell wall biosynthesis